MPLVKIDMFPGRSADVKEALAVEITAAFERIAGIAPDATTILFNEVQPSDWFQAGTSFSKPQKP